MLLLNQLRSSNLDVLKLHSMPQAKSCPNPRQPLYRGNPKASGVAHLQAGVKPRAGSFNHGCCEHVSFPGSIHARFVVGAWKLAACGLRSSTDCSPFARARRFLPRLSAASPVVLPSSLASVSSSNLREQWACQGQVNASVQL